MDDSPDEQGTGSVSARYEFEVADVLASRRLFWPNAYWFDRAVIVALVSVGITTEVGGSEPWVWGVSYVLAAALAFRLFVLVPRTIATNQRSVIGKVNVVRLDEDGVYDDIAGFHDFVEWKMLTAVIEDDVTIGIRSDLRGGYSIPKRAFTTPEVLEAFVAYAQAHVIPRPEAVPQRKRPSPRTSR